MLRARQGHLQSSPNTPRSRELEGDSSEKSQSPIQVAKSWGRPIWTTEHTLKFLEKVSSALKIYASTTPVVPVQEIGGNRNGSLATTYHRHHKSAKVKSLRGDFIKVETLDKRYRPFYQEFKRWPKLNLLARLTHSPFESELDTFRTRDSQKSKFNKFSKIDSRTNTTSKFKTVGTIMTRKSRPSQQQETEAGTTTNNTVASRVNNKSGSDNKHCGYCEICHVEYDVLKVHLKSEEHLNFAKNDDNFVSLDKLIESGASVQKLLKLSNAVKKETVVNGFIKRSKKKLSYVKNCESEKEESSEECDKNGIANGSSEDDMIEDQEEDPLSLDSPRPKRKCMHSPTPVQFKTNKKDTKETDDNAHKSIESKIQATRIRGLRWNAPSPDSRPPIKEPPVYKVEKVSQNKHSTHCHTKGSTKTSSIENNTGKQVVVKLKRVRQSELNLLNNEAEQFMFPKTPTFSDSDTDEDRQTSEVNRTNNTTFDLPSSDRDEKKSSANKTKNAKISASQNQTQQQQHVLKKEVASPSSKRVNKRLEALIEENVKYTHESLGRLRFQETPIQPQVTVNTTPNWLPDDRMGDNSFLKSPGGTTQSRWANFRNKYQAIELSHKFNFERVPHNEPWYVTFQRQDVGFERAYEYFGNSTYNKLPYELGPLPPSGKEDCCKLEELIPPNLRALNGSTKKRGSSCPRMPSIAKVNDRTRSSTAAIIEATKVVDANDDTTNDSIKTKSYLPLKKRKLFLDDVPRKSPREHASTLAILSSLSKEGSSTTSSICGVNRSGIKRERLPSQLSFEDDDDNSNCTMTSQQTIKTVATEKDNSSVCSITNNNLQNKFVNMVKLCKQVDEMLVSGEGEADEDDLYDICLRHCAVDKSEQKPEDGFVLINSKDSDIDINEVMNICSTQELTLKSVASKEKEVQRKITYTSKPKLVTSGFRFNKKSRHNRTGWQKICRKSSQPTKDKDDENYHINTEFVKSEDKNKNLTPDIFAVSSDSLDTNVVDFIQDAKDKMSTNGLPDNDSEQESADEEEPPSAKSPIKPSKPNNVFCRGIGKYQFEKYPKVNLTPISISNMKTRSSDLQKRKSVTPKKYTDSQNESLRSPGSNPSPQKFSPRKLRKPRGRWYRER